MKSLIINRLWGFYCFNSIVRYTVGLYMPLFRSYKTLIIQIKIIVLWKS